MAAAKMPDTIHLGPLTYTVEAEEELTDTDGETELWGVIQHGMERVRIDADLTPRMARITLLHEVLHGILCFAGQAEDEGLICAVSTGIYQLLRDNPKLVDWLREAV